MPGFLPENPGVIKMDVIPEIRRLHFVEHVTISDLAKQFKLSRPTIRKHLNTIEEPVYPTRQHQPYFGKFQAGCRLNIKSYAAILSGLTTSWGELFWV